MLTRKYRLTRKADIDRIFRRGQSISRPEIALKFSPNNIGQSRITTIVGTKLSKKAPIRNRIKRRLREIVRLNLSKIPTGIDLLVIARDIRLHDTDFCELTKKVLDMISRIKVSQSSN